MLPARSGTPRGLHVVVDWQCVRMTTNMTTPSYSWFETEFPDLAEAYCLTLVKGIPPRDLFGILGAREVQRTRGIQAIVDFADETWEEHEEETLLLCAVQVEGWTLCIEPYGYLGSLDETVGVLSRDTELVSVFRDSDASSHFLWARHGTIRLHFEPPHPGKRDGSDPDGLVEAMREVGFATHPADAHPAEREPVGAERHSAGETDDRAALALAERLTGVRLTPELLDETTYVCGVVAGR